MKLGLALSGLREWHLGLFTQIGIRSYLHFKYILLKESTSDGLKVLFGYPKEHYHTPVMIGIR